MNKYLSLIFLYNRAGGRKLLLTAAIIPIGFILIFLIRVGNPYEAGSYMLMERAFGGIWAVLPKALSISMYEPLEGYGQSFR